MKPAISIATNVSEEKRDKPDSFGREFQTDEGRRITVSRAAIMFIKDLASGEAEIGLRNARPILVRASYDEIISWWQAPPAKFRPLEERRARN